MQQLLENYIVIAMDYNIEDVSYVQAYTSAEAATYAPLHLIGEQGRVLVFPIDKDTPVNFRLTTQTVPSANIYMKSELFADEGYSFITDTRLMYDFLQMTYAQFIQKHNVTPQTYAMTMREFIDDKAGTLADLMRVAENMYIEELNDRDTYKDLPFASKDLKNAVVTYANVRISLQEYEEFCELCNSMGC